MRSSPHAKCLSIPGKRTLKIRTFPIYRRRRDSNPRDDYSPNGFQDRRLQPLGHSSTYGWHQAFPVGPVARWRSCSGRVVRSGRASSPATLPRHHCMAVAAEGQIDGQIKIRGLPRMALSGVFGDDWARTFQRRRTGFFVIPVLGWGVAPAQPHAILFLAFLGRYFSMPSLPGCPTKPERALLRLP